MQWTVKANFPFKAFRVENRLVLSDFLTAPINLINGQLRLFPFFLIFLERISVLLRNNFIKYNLINKWCLKEIIFKIPFICLLQQEVRCSVYCSVARKPNLYCGPLYDVEEIILFLTLYFHAGAVLSFILDHRTKDGLSDSGSWRNHWKFPMSARTRLMMTVIPKIFNSWT